ncbi:MAG: alpha/beta hydrolase [Dehalococcoidia bacterium]|nr:alpha/beta hydrolase [Dehalococcoidia bacterium]MCB9491996.1 alpha/beta hydrolase [Dehalococcoidia bacterium]
MPLDPLAVKFLEASSALQPPIWQLAAAEARARRVLPPPGPEVHEVMDMEAAGPDGPIPVRIYWPSDEADLPALVWYHGGGWTIGSIEGADATCRRLCTMANCVVINVEYRLGPEHPFPAAVDDAYAIAVWAVQNAPRMNIDPTRIAIGGDSAGGNLAAVTCLLLRDRGGPTLAHQLLVYPVTDGARDTKSYEENAPYVLTPELMDWFYDAYLPAPMDRLQPLASPLRAESLEGLPSATVITAEYDPLRDEGMAYADRLAAAGVPVEAKCYDGQIHTFFVNAHYFPVGLESVEWAASRLAEAFGE